MKTTGSVQEKNGRFYFVINLYDANGKRRIKWISTGLTVRGNKRKAESMLREVLLHYDKTGELPTGRGGAYEKVDAKTAKPLPQPLQPVNKSEMLFLDYLNEWVQVHKASIQPATFISYNRMITGRIDGKKVLVQADRAKTKSSLRTLPLVPPIRDRLLMLKGQQDTYRRLCGKSYNRDYLGYLCVDEIGNIIRPNYVSEQFPKLLEKNGLRPIRFHDLRHSCASLLLANGVPMKQIQEWLGHSDFSTTANIYAHLDYASKLSSAQAMLEGLGYGNASA